MVTLTVIFLLYIYLKAQLTLADDEFALKPFNDQERQ